MFSGVAGEVGHHVLVGPGVGGGTEETHEESVAQEEHAQHYPAVNVSLLPSCKC